LQKSWIKQCYSKQNTSLSKYIKIRVAWIGPLKSRGIGHGMNNEIAHAAHSHPTKQQPYPFYVVLPLTSGFFRQEAGSTTC
jgi:hypothetical protein